MEAGRHSYRRIIRRTLVTTSDGVFDERVSAITFQDHLTATDRRPPLREPTDHDRLMVACQSTGRRDRHDGFLTTKTVDPHRLYSTSGCFAIRAVPDISYLPSLQPATGRDERALPELAPR